MTVGLRVFTILMISTLLGCDKLGLNSDADLEVSAPGDVAATVNGDPISEIALKSLTEELILQRGGEPIPEDQVLDEVIKREILRQESVKNGLLKDPKLMAKIENSLRMLISQAAAERFVAEIKLTDEDLKKEYEAQVSNSQDEEYRARHILVDTEASAKALIDRLQKGEKFDVLAKKFSKDPGTKNQGGELGWFGPKQMVPPFMVAVASLKNGEYTKAPVQSQFGWHVIEREESRQQSVPAFDAVKEQLRGIVRAKKVQAHIAELQSKAKVEIKASSKKQSDADNKKDSDKSVPPVEGDGKGEKNVGQPLK